jgi:putative N6-adenine-specific DNA methylase
MSSEKYVMVAKTFAGLEEVLREELEGIGASDIEVLEREVKFTGSKEMLYKANFCCRTALRILMVVKEFKVKSSNDLYNGVRSIEWLSYFDVQQTFSVNSTVESEAFNNSMFVSLKTKDAIIDQFKAKLGKRPSVNAENPDIRVTVHASSDEVSISLDSSGESLHRRGYRLGQSESVMNEVLAAGILKIVGWKGQSDFYDPMCGLGVLPIEAALIARNIPPGIFRKSFAFEKWKDFDEVLFDSVYNAEYEIPFEHTIYASDIVPVNIKISTENARNAGLKKDIQFSVADFSTLKPVSDSGLLIVCPPLGQRNNDRAVEPVFAMIGDSMKNNFKGIKAWVFSSSEEGFKSIGLKSSTRVTIFNGTHEFDLRSYDIYEGSKVELKQDFRQRPSEDRSKGRGNFRGSDRQEYRGAHSDREFRPRDEGGRASTNRRSDFKNRDNSTNQSSPRSDFKSRSSEGAIKKEFKPRGEGERSWSGRGRDLKSGDNLNSRNHSRADMNGPKGDRSTGRDFKSRNERGISSSDNRNDYKSRESQNVEKSDFKSRIIEDSKGRDFKPKGGNGRPVLKKRDDLKSDGTSGARSRTRTNSASKSSEEPKRSFKKPNQNQEPE